MQYAFQLVFICALCICVSSDYLNVNHWEIIYPLYLLLVSFLSVTILGCNEVAKKVQVYKGKIIYRRMLKQSV